MDLNKNDSDQKNATNNLQNCLYNQHNFQKKISLSCLMCTATQSLSRKAKTTWHWPFRKFSFVLLLCRLQSWKLERRKKNLKIGFMSTSCKMTTDLVFLFIASSGEKKSRSVQNQLTFSLFQAQLENVGNSFL